MRTDRWQNGTQNDVPFDRNGLYNRAMTVTGIKMKRSIYILSAILVLLPLTGCGQSGPLYLPGNPSTIETVPSVPADPGQQDNDEKEQEKSGAS